MAEETMILKTIRQTTQRHIL